MKRSKFNLSHTQLLTGHMGNLIPIGILEVLPGDTIQHASQALIRSAPLSAPPMHPVRIDVRHFFVPFRLIWEDFEKFITGGPDGMDESVFPTMVLQSESPTGYYSEVESIFDYLGVKPDVSCTLSALPIRAVNLIWNEYYRDQDLQPERVISTASGVDTTTEYTKTIQVNWEKDYFTTARPWEQKGPDVLIPIGSEATGTARIHTLRNVTLDETQTPLQGLYGVGTGPSNEGVTPGKWPRNDWLDQNQGPHEYEWLGDVNVDLSTATAASVNDLRLALALQRYQEARARFGSRYTEYLRYLGVRSSDARLQRPEYLGGGRTNLQFSEVLSTNVGAEGSELPGIFGGHGIGANRTNRYRKFFEEHGFVISFLSVLPQTMYPDGLFRLWNRRTKEDFFQKELQHIGQQTILNKEVQLDHTDPDDVFGYQDRYDEYRRSESQVHGYFRHGEYLDNWHFARNVPGNASINSDFVMAQPSTQPFQSFDDSTLYCAIRHQIVARRILAARGSSFIL